MLKLWWGLVRFGFRLLYNEMAFTYDLVSKVVSLGQWRCWQRAGLKYLSVSAGARVLELAHGTGDLQLDLNQAGYRSFGYDLSPAMGRITWRKLRKHGVAIRLTQGMAQRLPFVDHAFDAVICTFPTPFIFEPATLQEAYRVLKGDGRFVIVINGVFTGGGVMTHLLKWLYRVTGQRAESADEHSDEQQFAQMLAVFEAAGFEASLIKEPCNASYAQVIIAGKTEQVRRKFTAF